MVYLSQLESVKEGSNLFNVYALDNPIEAGGVETFLGTLQLENQMTRSSWGDTHLFFRHQAFDEDVKTHTSWAKYAPKFCPFGRS